MPGLKIQELVERIGNLLRAAERAAGASFGLQPVHLQSLLYLSRCNRLSDTPAAVTDFLGATKGTVSQTLGVLERNGFLERRPDADDGRKVHLCLPRRGERACQAVAPLPAVQEATERLPEPETLVGGLESLLRGLQRANSCRTFGVCRTCRHFQVTGRERFQCGLTGEPLRPAESLQICREHEPPPEPSSR